MATSWRSLYRFLVPSWLSEGDGEKVLHSLAYVMDAFSQKMRDGLEARFPTRAGPSALALIGADRGIPRGRTETDAHYAQRLIRWRYPRGHRVRGSAYALLEQISEYFGGLRCWTIDIRGNKHVRTFAGAESYSYANAWNWDGTTTPKYRFWVVLDPVPYVAIGPWPALGSGQCWGGSLQPGRGYTLGQTGVTPDDARAIKRLFTSQRGWKPAGTRAEFAIITLTDHNTSAAPAPDGSWSRWSGRDGAFRYWYLRA